MIATQPQSNVTSLQELQQALEKAKRILAVLETQASGYTSLTIPAHLQIELEDKRKEIVKLEADLQLWYQSPDRASFEHLSVEMKQLSVREVVESLAVKALDIAWDDLTYNVKVGALLLNKGGTFDFVHGTLKRILGKDTIQAGLLRDRNKQTQRLFTLYANEPEKIVVSGARIAYVNQKYFIPNLEEGIDPRDIIVNSGVPYNVDQALGIDGYQKAAMKFRAEADPKKSSPFPGTTVRISEWDSDRILVLSLSNYLDQYVTNQREIVDTPIEQIVQETSLLIKPDWLKRTLRNINIHHARLQPFNESLLANSIGVAATVITCDGYLVLPRRNQNVHFQSGYESCSISGVLEWSDFILVDFMGTLKHHIARREGPEEILLDPQKITIHPLGFARELERAGKPQFFFHIWTDYRLENFLEKWKQSSYPRYEFDSVRWIEIYEYEALRSPEIAINQAVERILALLSAEGYITLKDGYQVVLSEEVRANLFYLLLFLQTQKAAAFPTSWISKP